MAEAAGVRRGAAGRLLARGRRRSLRYNGLAGVSRHSGAGPTSRGRASSVPPTLLAFPSRADTVSSEPKGRRGRALLRAIVWSPVIAIPMAAFVWFRDAAAPSAFGRHYVPTLIFVLAGWICLWIAQHFVFPRIVKPDAVGVSGGKTGRGRSRESAAPVTACDCESIFETDRGDAAQLSGFAPPGSTP